MVRAEQFEIDMETARPGDQIVSAHIAICAD
jgi:hypothetical protein